MNTEKIIREISLTKNLSKNRQKSYNHIIKHYENSNNKTLPELLEEAEIEEEGNTVVNATMFSEIIRRLPNSEIKLTVNENNLLVIECEGSLYKLSTMNAEEFPELPKIEVENSLETEQIVLRNMIKKTIFAVSNEENRPIFTGCLFEVENNKLNVVAVDGFRLALRSIYLQTKVNDFKAVIPGKALSEIIDTLTSNNNSSTSTLNQVVNSLTN